MGTSSKNIRVRSISLPLGSHPSTLGVDEEINKLKFLDASTASTSNSISKGLTSLENLFISVDELLNLASTQQVLSRHRDEKCIDELLNGSVRILDVCQATKDILAQIEEQVKGLQSALRRRKEDSSIETSICNFISFRKKMKKDVKKLIKTLKKPYNKSQLLDLDDHTSSVICSLREASSINISIFESLLVFLSAPVLLKPKLSKWPLALKVMHKAKITCEDKLTNELENVDVALFSLCRSALSKGVDVKRMQSAQKKLDALDIITEGLESSLERVSRRLIKTRASLLNIVSQ